MATWPAKVNYASGDILTASQMNDIGGELNDLYTAAGFAAGKNKIINGDFYINQRSFTSTTTNLDFMFDRWQNANTGGTSTFSAQTFTAGTAPVAGYELANFLQVASTGQSAAGDRTMFLQKIEDVRTFAGQTATISFWAKAASGTPKVAVEFSQNFGSGGSTAVTGIGINQFTLSTSWTRYSATVSISSVSGKTIGAGSYLQVTFWTSAGSTYNSRTNTLGIQTATISFAGVQMEAGSVATPFQTATGTIQGELAACQRYYWRQNTENSFGYFAQGAFSSATNAYVTVTNPVQMRTSPSSLDYSTLYVYDFNGSFAVTSAAISTAGSRVTFLALTIASGGTQYRPGLPRTESTGYIGLSAEL